MSFAQVWLAFCATQILATALHANTSADSKAGRFFENEVRPLLAKHCFECHGEDESSGDLRLDSLAAMLAGGESGPALVPGKPEKSTVVEAINYESYEMPPSGKLDQADIDTLTRWVKAGAPWPGSDPDKPIRKKPTFDDDDRSWWAIAPLEQPDVPQPDQHSGWPRNVIDHFVLNRMTEQALSPAPLADRSALVRRVYLDVTGLPPSPDQVDAFLGDTSDNAYERLIDRLLQSKAYGQHAARWWLDLVRYADSDGYRADGYRPDAWRYRDYVIRSLNDDKPYDRFVQEQIAADELFPDDLDAQLALGYLRHWVYEWNIRDARTQWKTIMEDLTDTTADVFMGLGLQCAKCHNHKFDPLLQKDYFRLQAFFAPILPIDAELVGGTEYADYNRRLRQWELETESIRDQIAEIEQPYREKYRNIAIDRFPEDLQQIARKPDSEKTPHDVQLAYLIQRQVQAEYDRLDKYIKGDDKEKLVQFRRQLKEHEKAKPTPPPRAMVVTDVGAVAPPTRMPKRKRDVIAPGVPSIIDPAEMPIDPDLSGRTTGRRGALANWLTRGDNPLTTRVIVNRLWQTHFGRGLAANASDFGRLGGAPSHPDLLDFLAVRFVEDGWSLKSMHKLILMSATYRQSTRHPDFERQQQIDPANEFYWRRNTRRLAAEQIRDSLLFVSGKLDDRDSGPGKPADSTCRSIFTRVMRNSPDQLLASFDLPQFFSSHSSRNTTTTPIQSLMLINSDQMLGYARGLAERVRKASADRETQITQAWRWVYGRHPTETELATALTFVERQEALLRSTAKKEPVSVIETSKLPYRDGQAVSVKLDDADLRLSVAHDDQLNTDEFTVEAFFELRSIAKTGAVRTLIAKWNGSKSTGGWRFGVTGAGSRRKPQTLVLQMMGKLPTGQLGEAAIFSDQHVEINTPYYAAASFRLPQHDDGGNQITPGSVTFYLKDLSNDDEPLSTVTIEHSLTDKVHNTVPLTIGRRDGRDPQGFDGLIDDVRLVGRAIGDDEILHAVERDLPQTLGFWRFEIDPGVRRNSASDSLNLSARGDALVELTATKTALADFCHALLNSNGFLYTH